MDQLVAERDTHRAVARQLRNTAWGKDLDQITIRAVVRWAERHAIDPATELDCLGGSLYPNAAYFRRRLTHVMGEGALEYSEGQHVHPDPRLDQLAANEEAPHDLRQRARREQFERQLLRAQFNLPDHGPNAGDLFAAVVWRIKVRGVDREFVAAKWVGGKGKVTRKRKDGQTYQSEADPIGDANPVETAETRAFRRCARLVVDALPGLKAEFDTLEAGAQELEGLITADRANQRAERAAGTAARRGVADLPDPFAEDPQARERRAAVSARVIDVHSTPGPGHASTTGTTTSPGVPEPAPASRSAGDAPSERQRALFDQLLRSSAWSEEARWDWHAKAEGLTRREFSDLLTELKDATGAAKAAAKRAEAVEPPAVATDPTQRLYEPLEPPGPRPILDPATLDDDGLPF